MNLLEMEDQVRQAGEAEHILSHPLVRSALLALKADAYEKIESTKPSQTAEREFLYHRIQAINGFESQFTYHIEEGRMARGIIEEYRARQQAKRRRT